MPPEICKTPKTFQTTGEMLFIKEQGGSINPKNLSAPTIKKRRLQMPVMILLKFMIKLNQSP